MIMKSNKDYLKNIQIQITNHKEKRKKELKFFFGLKIMNKYETKP